MLTGDSLKSTKTKLDTKGKVKKIKIELFANLLDNIWDDLPM
jgi:hypothetical protein